LPTASIAVFLTAYGAVLTQGAFSFGGGNRYPPESGQDTFGDFQFNKLIASFSALRD
jgi:hypothetical protein